MDTRSKLNKLPVSFSGDRAPRMPIQTPIVATHPRRGGQRTGMTVNISRTGVLAIFESAIPFDWQVEENFDLRLESIPGYCNEVVQGRAKLIRIGHRKVDAGHEYLTAFHFAD